MKEILERVVRRLILPDNQWIKDLKVIEYKYGGDVAYTVILYISDSEAATGLSKLENIMGNEILSLFRMIGPEPNQKFEGVLIRKLV